MPIPASMRKPDVDPAAVRAVLGRVFGSADGLIIARTPDGTSTKVYRVQRGEETFYLRGAETECASLALEALAHRLLRAHGVRVPEVVHLEPFDAGLRRSVMVTTAIPGQALARLPPGRPVGSILAEAGRDLALLNGVPVAGFGWVRRDDPAATSLRAELPSLAAFALGGLDDQLRRVRGRFFPPAEVAAIGRAVAAHRALLDLEAGVGSLAHGDLDLTHVFQRDGVYTGLIDLGEIRGAEPTYDLGHVALHDGETLPVPGLPALLAGYREVSPLSDDHLRRIHLSALLIGVRALARASERPPAAHHRGNVAATRRMLAALAA
ncbi:MAG: hypothetical protein AVDCRST_MAG49-336 [uncultured Thermomicrobiales bacterium]|uniref:Aminoglycoside phosphotransferase domain-containing protein n=1 Tax=uncultured Thermomicrobiales bacterium TaxID=1645740 RepID=A0A6J4U057_9BACT|nr:MAG: hypothetical protein AVDCRST_MAG49-336 [uncultured Thermomicrobiales bacterium]